MEYLLRDVLVERREVLIDDQGKRQVVGSVGDPAGLLGVVKPRQWNDYTVIVDRGRVNFPHISCGIISNYRGGHNGAVLLSDR